MIDRRPTTTAFFLTLTLLLFAFIATPWEARAAEPEQAGSEKKGKSAATPYLRPLAPGKAGAPAFDGKFSIDRDQTIAILGGTNALEMQRSGHLETRMAIAFPEYQLRVRNMAWQADTVYRQQRPRHFFQPAPIRYPGDTDGRQPLPVDTIILWMGQSESLEGTERLGDFRKAYNAMLDQLTTITPRIVLVTPVPFEKTEAVPLDVRPRNKTLLAYVGVIKKIGIERELPVVDLFGAILLGRLKGHLSDGPWTRNGMHLNESGRSLSGIIFAERLGLLGDASEPTDLVSVLLAEELRKQVIKKNELWFRYWRPTNWAFLYGNRSLQPSSRDHTDNKKRWFPKEVASIAPLVAELDEQIHQAAKNAAATRDK